MVTFNSCFTIYSAIIVGFEQTTYTFEEPTVQSFSTERICLSLITGQIDQTYRFRVQWNAITAAQGLPGAGGDFNPSQTVYQFAPGVRSNCINVLIYRDNAFESREEFSGQIVSIQLPDGTNVPSVAGITIQPGTTRAFIESSDGKTLLCSLIVQMVRFCYVL